MKEKSMVRAGLYFSLLFLPLPNQLKHDLPPLANTNTIAYIYDAAGVKPPTGLSVALRTKNEDSGHIQLFDMFSPQPPQE